MYEFLRAYLYVKDALKYIIHKIIQSINQMPKNMFSIYLGGYN